MSLESLLKKYKTAKITWDVNYKKIPTNRLGMDEDGMSAFNKIYSYLLKNYPNNKITRTPSGGISIRNLRLPCWDVIVLPYCVELTIISTVMTRLQFRSANREIDQPTSGSDAFKMFKFILMRKYKMDFREYAIQNGKDIKKEIEPAMIKFDDPFYRDMTLMNCHHIDFHSSYPAGLANTHEEFREPLEYMYSKRKENEHFKGILDYSIGYMQSKLCGYKYVHLARDAINDNNKRVRDLAKRLKASGRTVLLYNTDGIWYMGEVYHGDGEGPNLGQWHNDHVNCQLRAKSAGCYEYIEDGVYKPVVRGRTNYDTIKSRENWQWGDIYREECQVIKYLFVEGKGVIKYE